MRIRASPPIDLPDVVDLLDAPEHARHLVGPSAGAPSVAPSGAPPSSPQATSDMSKKRKRGRRIMGAAYCNTSAI
jgi:hypothetical protein